MLETTFYLLGSWRPITIGKNEVRDSRQAQMGFLKIILFKTGVIPHTKKNQ